MKTIWGMLVLKSSDLPSTSGFLLFILIPCICALICLLVILLAFVGKQP
uniref:Uncharacterized protein n=1 Tax=Anguilla anguilla TaxID=7936 RepID=A0A0E9QGY5_ANGAN